MSPAAKAPGSRGTPNHSATYGAEQITKALTAIQLHTTTVRRAFAATGTSLRFAQRSKHKPVAASVTKAQNAA
nr:hypothetical protein [Glycomyces buryatensis]